MVPLQDLVIKQLYVQYALLCAYKEIYFPSVCDCME